MESAKKRRLESNDSKVVVEVKTECKEDNESQEGGKPDAEVLAGKLIDEIHSLLGKWRRICIQFSSQGIFRACLDLENHPEQSSFLGALHFQEGEMKSILAESPTLEFLNRGYISWTYKPELDQIWLWKIDQELGESGGWGMCKKAYPSLPLFGNLLTEMQKLGGTGFKWEILCSYSST